MPIVNFYTVQPNEIKAGDVFVVTVTLHVQAIDKDGHPAFAMYRCPWPNPEIGGEGVPQGDHILKDLAEGVQRGLFPVISYIDGYPSPY